VDGAVGEWRRKRGVHAPVLVDEWHTVEIVADDGHLEVVAAARPVFDVDGSRSRKRILEQPTYRRRVHAVMLVAPRYPAGMRLLRGLLLFKLGFWAGMYASAAILKRTVPSRGDEESDELALVAILDGVELKSRAREFRGGSLFSWLGGIAVDLRDAQLTGDAHLDVHSAFGGIAIRVPPTWRIESNVKALGGGVTIPPTQPADDAPTLRLDGFTAFGGIAVDAKAAES
jgi:hypothetical protein